MFLSAVDAFARDDVTNTARWVYSIAQATRYQVEVAVEDSLSCCFPVVYSNVESFYVTIRLFDSLLLLY